ncbi:MAG: hypothetical protein AMXMBFR84_07940 [Candidatus Hydrogenedentota bacterium]
MHEKETISSVGASVSDASDLEMRLRYYSPLGLHLSREAWERYRLAQLLKGGEEGRTPDEVRAIRHLAKSMNEIDSPETHGWPYVGAGQLLSLGLLSDILRYVAAYYVSRQIPGILDKCLEWNRSIKTSDVLQNTLGAFVRRFPPEPVAVDRSSDREFAQKTREDMEARVTAHIEMILLRLAMSNPALRPFVRLFNDELLRHEVPYVEIIHDFETFFANQPPVDEIGETLFECLRLPMKNCPDSLEDQLEYIRRHWGRLLPKSLLRRVLMVQGIVREETATRGMGDGPNLSVLDFRSGKAAGFDEYPEPERYSPDADWMANVVLIAKTAYVWLDQLSKKYQRHIHRLDQIPDDELDQLARRGFNGLWLIGVWERSPASEDIKRWTGNPEAIASAYSLFDYTIAADLGGDDAYRSLNERARSRGIRLASDMVPNHMGIYSRWVVEHPNWFVQLNHPPYPSYSFSGGNLSRDERVSIQIEDGYWDRRDAAVVFKRVDKWSGDTRYIYHGNDGTSMPWNDTAQLNYLLPEVREAVIQTILHVARMFSIIRFDAAMTLAKKHYQRLWFPKAGDAGAIPSRAEHGMTKEEFDKVFPVEFWREVVDRVAAEAPDTLLLAEAFWLMEGYFVRTLGMHRVYNSAFMNMMKMEENQKYRQTIKNVIEYSPGILRRFVNFMNNPDEMTAAEQFGVGDKYFGVAAMMATIPGLPMFGHGQIEGLREKYGMEYRRAYWDETADEGLVQRHHREIFPLLRRRYLFSSAEQFAFYDFYTPHGYVDENVFAYSNRHGNERSLFLYNNAYNTTQGWIKGSTPINKGSADSPNLVSSPLADALGIRSEANWYCVYRDHREGLDYIREGRKIRDEGLFFQLHGYQYYALLDFREVEDTDGTWARLAAKLDGRGTPSIDRERRELMLEPLLDAFRAVFNAATLTGLMDSDYSEEEREDRRESAEVDMQAFTLLFSQIAGFSLDAQGEGPDAREYMDAAMELPGNLKAVGVPDDVAACFLERIQDSTVTLGYNWRIITAWTLLKPLDRILKKAGHPNWLEEWLLSDRVVAAFHDMGREWWQAHEDAALVKLLLDTHEGEITALDEDVSRFRKLIEPEPVRRFLGLNHHQGHDYIVKEQLATYLYWRLLAEVVHVFADHRFPTDTALAVMVDEFGWTQRVIAAAGKARYDVGLMYAELAAAEAEPEPALDSKE